jgi:hypothetical protein
VKHVIIDELPETSYMLVLDKAYKGLSAEVVREYRSHLVVSPCVHPITTGVGILSTTHAFHGDSDQRESMDRRQYTHSSSDRDEYKGTL